MLKEISTDYENSSHAMLWNEIPRKKRKRKKEKQDFPFWFFSGFVERERGKRKKKQI